MDFTPGLGQTINSLPDPDFSSFTSPNIVQNPQPSPQSLNAQLMSLGMTEPLPPDDVMEEL